MKTGRHYVFSESDTSFDLPWMAYNELRLTNRLAVTNVQLCELQHRYGNGEFPNLESFCRRLATCVNLCLGFATGLSPTTWPHFQEMVGPFPEAQSIKCTCQTPAGGPAYFLAAGMDQEMYWKSFQEQYTHSSIGQKLQSSSAFTHYMPSMILLFSQDFQEIIELKTTTTFRDRTREESCYTVCVNVACHRSLIQPGQDCHSMRTLAALCQRL
ncbi:uncharacterized protein LOC122254274 [Penaeus japonicus]|uniref:uncharacterized protein LOC122254274 n=1 Tax=Penaeus japonicus TaxID=27405 RepID=UPI001C70DE15|nr:uncharacterized protein LOC122254274 [Penaeus japonicus]